MSLKFEAELYFRAQHFHGDDEGVNTGDRRIMAGFEPTLRASLFLYRVFI